MRRAQLIGNLLRFKDRAGSELVLWKPTEGEQAGDRRKMACTVMIMKGNDLSLDEIITCEQDRTTSKPVYT